MKSSRTDDIISNMMYILKYIDAHEEKILSDLMYILECLMLYKKIVESGDCNICGKEPTCRYKPRIGQMVRYNCPFYEGVNYESGN